MRLHNHSRLVSGLRKMPQIHSGERTASSADGPRKLGIHIQRVKLEFSLSPCTKSTPNIVKT